MYGFGYPASTDFFSFGRLRHSSPTTRLNFSRRPALPGNAIIIDTLTQNIEEAFPNEVGEISDLDALVFIVNDSSFLDICTLLPFTFNLILGVSTFFPSHVFLKCTVIF